MADTAFPAISGAEQLEMLQLRDRLLELAADLSAEEKEFLAHADRCRIQQAPQVRLELSQFIDLATQHRLRKYQQNAGGGTWMSWRTRCLY